jgi:hypothetical protein
MQTLIYQFPAQKKTLAEKTDDWAKQCIESCISITTGDTSKIRKSRVQKKLNYDLINGIMDESDIEKAFNPMGIRGVAFPAKIQNYPIEISKFNVLKGEESRRRFDWKIRCVNSDVVSQKEFIMQQQIYNAIVDELVSEQYDEDMASRRLKQLQHYHQYTYQDYSETMAHRIMDYFWYTQKLRNTFSDTFYDVLLGAEEIFCCEILHGEPSLTRKNTLNISTFGMGDDYKIENSTIIVDDGYYPIGKVIDDYWDVLDSSEVDKLEEGGRQNRYWGEKVLPGPIDPAAESQYMANSQLITVDGNDTWNYGGYFDNDGNIRVTKCIWQSMRKIGELTYFDPDGNEQKTIVDERFPIKQFESLGWHIKWYWIKEWWRGDKVGVDMFKRIGPLPRIGSKMSNPSFCLPPYVGSVYNIGGGQGVSLMDRVKPYKYLYNVYMRRTELASARNKGVIAELDLAEIPDGWDEELVMMFAEANGYMIKDSFKEGKKGIAQGKLISTLKQRGSDVLNLNSADVIRANLELARYVKNELGEIAGITPQREGQIDNRETYGGVERSVTQSSHITEEWFRLHDITKIRAMELLMETAKYAWKNLSGDAAKKLQYVDDGLITHLFTVDGRQFAESEYGYYVSDGQNDTELVQTIKQLALTAMQNDKATFKDIFTIYRDTSVSGMIRKLEDSEERQIQREDDARKEQLESQERAAQALQQVETMKMEQEFRIAQNKLDAELYMKEMELDVRLMEIEAQATNAAEEEKQKADVEKLRMQLAQKREEMKEKSKQFYDKLEQDRKLMEKQMSSNEKIAKSRSSAKTIKK